MPRLRCLMIVGSMVSTALLALALPATAATASTGPRIAPAGHLAALTASGTDDYLNGDSCIGSSFCMAVGGYNRSNYTHGLSEMLSGGSGASWVVEPVATPSGGRNVFANEISCATPIRCLFVGDHWAGKHGAGANLAEAWNGSSWRVVAAAGPAKSAVSYLNDVACPTTSFCLAIGAAGRTSSRNQATAYKWTNDRTWRRIAVPHPKGARDSELGGLACFSSKNCLAVGNYASASGRGGAFAARWHNGKWKLLTAPGIHGQRFVLYESVSCPTATRCVTVGLTEDNTRGRYYHAFAETLNGGKWHLSMLRGPASFLYGVSCPAQNRCFASGGTFPTHRSLEHPLIETWNGKTWTAEHPASTAAPLSLSGLDHVSCASRSNCEAVGFSYDPSNLSVEQTLAEMWNGSLWTLQTTVNP